MKRERKLQVLIALGALLLIITAALCLTINQCNASNRNKELIADDNARFAFKEESCLLSPGDQLALSLSMGAEDIESPITWSSSDARVLVVDGSGTVTACAEGVAAVTVSCGAMSDSITVFVADNAISAAGDCIKALAEGCNAERLHNAQLLAEFMSKSDDQGINRVSNIIYNIVAYTNGGCRESLEQAVSESIFDKETCRAAAASCWAYGEQLTCDGVITFVGDCTFARYNEYDDPLRFPAVYAASGSRTYPFDRVKGIFACDDLTLINFEGTLTGSTKHFDKSFFFRGDPEYAGMLPLASVEAANMANNHIYDYYQRGYDDTRMYLTEAGVSIVEVGLPLTVSLGDNGVKVALIAETSAAAIYSEEIHASLLGLIKQHKGEGSVVIVNLHWGAEGASEPADWQIMIAHELVDAGADMIIGHHSHVLQGIEMYKGKYVAYSLGNFSFGGNSTVNWPETVILRAKLGLKDGAATVTGISILPCLTTSTGTDKNNYQPMLCFGEDGDRVYDVLVDRSKALGEVSSFDRPDI